MLENGPGEAPCEWALGGVGTLPGESSRTADALGSSLITLSGFISLCCVTAANSDKNIFDASAVACILCIAASTSSCIVDDAEDNGILGEESKKLASSDILEEDVLVLAMDVS